MADDPKPNIARPPIGRSKDFRVVYSNTFRFRTTSSDIGIAFGYQTEVPTPSGHRTIIQDEVEIVITPTTLKLLKMGFDDILEGVERIIGTIQLSKEILDAIAEQKVEAAAKTEKK